MKTKSEFEKWLESPEALRCMNTLELLGENTRTTCIFQLKLAFAAGERKGRIAGLREAAELCSGDSHIEEGIRAKADRLERGEEAL